MPDKTSTPKKTDLLKSQRSEMIDKYIAKFGCKRHAAVTACRTRSKQWQAFEKECLQQKAEELKGGGYDPKDGVKLAQKNKQVCDAQYMAALEMVEESMETAKRLKFVPKNLKDMQMAVSRAQDNATKARVELETAMKIAGELVASSELEVLTTGLKEIGFALSELPELSTVNLPVEQRKAASEGVRACLISRINPLVEKLILALS
jgi:hypothetical protein